MLKKKSFFGKNKRTAALAAAFLMAALCIFGQALPLYAADADSNDSADFRGDTDSDSLASYGMLPIYGNEIRNGEYSIDVKISDPALVFKEARLTVTNGKMSAQLTVENEDYTQLKTGNTSYTPLSGEDKSVFSVSVETLDQEISCAVYDAASRKWCEYKILFEASSLPKEALLVELPDYDLIEKAVNAYDNPDNDEEDIRLEPVTPVDIDRKDGEYSVSLEMEGGSGKAYITSPTLLIVRDGKAYAHVEWSSSNYDYMIVGTEKYMNMSEENANSVFEIPIACWDQEMTVIGDTTAMGTPHEVEYTLVFYKDSIGSKGQLPQEAAKRVVILAVIIIVGGGILNYFLKKKN